MELHEKYDIIYFHQINQFEIPMKDVNLQDLQKQLQDKTAEVAAHVETINKKEQDGQAQIAALTTDQFVSMATDDLAAISTSRISALTTAQVAALTTDQLVALTTSQTAAWSTSQVPALTTGQTVALTTAQTSAFTTAQLVLVAKTLVAAGESGKLPTAGLIKAAVRRTGNLSIDPLYRAPLLKYYNEQ